MTQTENELPVDHTPDSQSACGCQSYLRATEHAALRSARWLGRADQEAAEESAAEGMRSTLDVLPISGRVVFGSFGGEGGLVPGAMLGAGGPEVDLALDPLEGRGVVARGGNGAMSMIAVGDPGRLMSLPNMYMRKLAVGPRARGSIDLLRPVAREHRGDRGGVRAALERRDDDRPRPAPASRPDRGDPQRPAHGSS